jgi:hypothetical protein
MNADKGRHVQSKKTAGRAERKTIIQTEEKRPGSGTIADRLLSISHQPWGASAQLLQQVVSRGPILVVLFINIDIMF